MHIKRILGASLALIVLNSVIQVNAVRAASLIQHSRLPRECSTSYNAYDMPVSFLRSCGDTVLPLRQVTPLPGGGHSYDYGSYTWLEPPAHLNLLTASDDQLAAYGLPTRNRLGPQWYAVMGQIRSFVRPSPYLVEVPAVSNVACTSNCTTNWVGHYVTGHTYIAVIGTWTEPHFKGAGCSGDAFSQWAGMGDALDSSGSLAQTGTVFNNPGFAAHQGFIQTITPDYNPGSVAVKGFVPSAGDSVQASITWSAPHYYYNLYDLTTHYASGALISRYDQAPDNSTAEIMSERSFIHGHVARLSDFQSVHVNGATSYWSGGSAGFVNNPHHYSVTMVNDANTRALATTSNLNSNSDFTNTWRHCS